MGLPGPQKRVRGLADHWKADCVLIENAGSGISLGQQLRYENRDRRYIQIAPKLDKRSRFEAQTARLEMGRYLLPRQANWLEPLRTELMAFQNGKYDDQVDSMVQFLEWSAGRRSDRITRRDPVSGRRLSRDAS